MSLLTIIAIVLATWCALSVVVAGLFSVAMRGMPDDPPAPALPTPLRVVQGGRGMSGESPQSTPCRPLVTNMQRSPTAS